MLPPFEAPSPPPSAVPLPPSSGFAVFAGHLQAPYFLLDPQVAAAGLPLVQSESSHSDFSPGLHEPLGAVPTFWPGLVLPESSSPQPAAPRQNKPIENPSSTCRI